MLVREFSRRSFGRTTNSRRLRQPPEFVERNRPVQIVSSTSRTRRLHVLHPVASKPGRVFFYVRTQLYNSDTPTDFPTYSHVQSLSVVAYPVRRNAAAVISSLPVWLRWNRLVKRTFVNTQITYVVHAKVNNVM